MATLVHCDVIAPCGVTVPRGVAVQRVIRLVRNEPGQVALYLLMCFVLRIAGAMISYFMLFIAALIALIPIGGGALALWFGLRHATCAC